MNTIEKEKAVEICRDILNTKKLKDDERIEKLLTYFNTIILKYKRLETFDEIDIESERNLRSLSRKGFLATSVCCRPFIMCWNLFKFVCALMFFISTLAGVIYILYYFGSRMF